MASVMSMARIGALALCVAMSGVAQAAGTGKAKLDHFFKDLKTMRAEFVQTLVDSRQEVKDQSEGVMTIARPGRFRLEYTKPYSQLYVADGKKVWSYDKDLEQVTVHPQEEMLGSTPALLLSSDVPLEKNFRLQELGDHEGFTWVELKPRQKDANFTYIRLALEGGVVRAMEMGDALGQMTRIYFNEVVRNVKVDPSSFQFTPPSGVDVVGQQK